MTDALRKLWFVLERRDRRGALLLGALMLGGAFLEALGVGALPAFVALLSTPERVTSLRPARVVFAALGADTEGERVLWAGLALGALFLCKNAYAAAVVAIQTRYLSRLHVRLSGRLFRAYFCSPHVFALQRNSSELLHGATNAVFGVVDSFLLPGLRLAMEMLVLGVMLALLVVAEPIVGPALVLLLGGITALAYRAIVREVTRSGEQAHRFHGRLIQAIRQALGAAQEIKVLGREEYFLRHVRDVLSVFAHAASKRVMYSELPRLCIETSAVLGMLLVVAYFVADGRALSTVVPVLTFIAVVALRLLPTANRVLTSVTAMRWATPALDRVYTDLRALEPTVPAALPAGGAASGPPITLEHAIDVDNVSFRYPGAATYALRDVTLTIPRGSVAALTGPSGSGKSTLVEVLTGLLTPTTGRVVVDDADIAGSLPSWRRQLGYVPQAVYLADDTIRANVAFGISEDAIDEGRVWAALETAHLGDFVRQLPASLDTRVGERGAQLSGGQCQRVGIARALYHDPAVLVFDEGTAALDEDTESGVLAAIEGLRGTRTVIVVAHRQHTISRCNLLFVLEDGRLVRTEARGGRPALAPDRVVASS